ncbi:hypothetical protein BIWAKO_01604 [Bosea sp. BIWAKO-01]|nr:hypothetical protein BIWAKO_01604 [Bosea sp. BIWAKO-01]
MAAMECPTQARRSSGIGGTLQGSETALMIPGQRQPTMVLLSMVRADTGV